MRKTHFLVLLTAFTQLVACSHLRETETEEKTELVELKKTVEQLQSKVQTLESKLAPAAPATAPLSAVENTPEPPLTSPSLPAVGIVEPLSQNAGAEPAEISSSKDPEAGFVNDSAVQTYRKAYLFYLANQFAESALHFAQFLDRYPDHPLAGSAQYYLGECHFKQKAYKQAAQEYQKVLTSYDRSSHVSLALRQLSETQDLLGDPENAAKNRQLLLSLFPQSPAADLRTSLNTTSASIDAIPAATTAPTSKAITHSNPSAPSQSSAQPSTLDGPPPTAPAE